MCGIFSVEMSKSGMSTITWQYWASSNSWKSRFRRKVNSLVEANLMKHWSKNTRVFTRGWSEYSVLDYSARSNDFFRYSKILDTRFCCIEYTRPDPILDIDTREYPSSISFMSKFMFLHNFHRKIVWKWFKIEANIDPVFEFASF